MSWWEPSDNMRCVWRWLQNVAVADGGKSLHVSFRDVNDADMTAKVSLKGDQVDPDRMIDRIVVNGTLARKDSCTQGYLSRGPE